MTQEDKDLLLRDLCCRLPYGFTIYRYSDNANIKINDIDEFAHFLEYSDGEEFKPYLRPMSSMTDEEWADCVQFQSSNIPHDGNEQHRIVTALMADVRARWYDEHMFDHRNLIPRGLALCKTDK